MSKGHENLIPMSERSKEEVRKIASKGGINSGKTRRKQKNMKEALNLLLGLEVSSPAVRDKMKKLGLEDDELTNEMALMVAMMNKAMQGDKGCAEFIRDTSGQKPVEVSEVHEIPRIVDDI